MADLKEKVLVLNKQWVPIVATTLKNAIKIISRNHARIIEPYTWEIFEWKDWLQKAIPLTEERKINVDFYLRTSGLYIPIPEVVVLSGYSKIPPLGIHFTRFAIFERDDYTCQYCGLIRKHGKPELTIDHLMPKSKGGHTTWDNCVTSCIKCNQKKKDKLLSECGMHLITKPYKPKARQIVWKSKVIKESWRAFLKEEHISD